MSLAERSHASPIARAHIGVTTSGLPQRSVFGVVLVVSLLVLSSALVPVTGVRSPAIASLLLAIVAGLSATGTT